MRVELRHLIEELLVGRRGFLQPIEVLEVTLGLLDAWGRKAAVACRAPVEVRAIFHKPAPPAAWPTKLKGIK